MDAGLDPEGRSPSRPASAIDGRIAAAGALCAVAAIVAGARGDLAPPAVALLAILSAVAPALVFDGAPRAVSRARAARAGFVWPRIATKWLGAAAALALAAAAVATFPFFHRPPLDWLAARAPTILFAGAPILALYIAVTDRLADEPEDGLLALGRICLGRPHDAGKLADFLRTLVVKLFFFSLMFVYVSEDVGFYRNEGLPRFSGDHADVLRLNRFIFTCDAALAALGYLATLKLFDWHVREADGTASGWAACLVCYEPFFPAMANAFLAYHGGDEAWRGALAEGGPGYWVWAGGFLACNFAYLAATVAFGPLFSNLTRRRIVTSGPYALTKHPAYLAKNAGWWIAELPALLAVHPVEALRRAAMLACVSAIYYARAVTEERLLGADPVYRAYAAHIAREGLLARLKRAFAPAARG
ncbi:MAG: hypothetical protein IPL88_05370 [Rhizobiales bacterium]|nr:hypothetical protein [Hyphomicrobiales bacterium]